MKTIGWHKREEGFSVLELCVTAAVVAVLIGVLMPKLLVFADGARRRQAREDALCLGAATALLMEEGDFDPQAVGAVEAIREEAGAEFPGTVSDIARDGSFVYTRVEGDKAYRVRFDAGTLTVTDLPDAGGADGDEGD